MKTLLKPYLLDFLKKQGYEYLVAQKTQGSSESSFSRTVLIPVEQKPFVAKPSVGFEECFTIADQKAGTAAVDNNNKDICVLLQPDDVVSLKKYLLQLS